MKFLHHLYLFILLFISHLTLYAQTGGIQGIVFDKGTGQRVGSVFVKNVKSKENTYNNARGEFEINVAVGDTVIASKDGFHADTIVYKDQKVLLVYLRRSSIHIAQIDVFARKSPEQVLAQRREEFNKAYKMADPGSIFSVGPTGAGISIGSIFNMLSKEGKNARRLTKVIQREYEDNVVDSKFTPDLVQHTTGLTGDQLRIFMNNFRPSYAFVMLATPYELSSYIRSKYEIFKLNPNLRYLPKLPDLDLEVNN